MNRTGYTLLGWIVWRIGTRIIRDELAQRRRKLAATGVVALVVVGGVVAARAASGDE